MHLKGIISLASASIVLYGRTLAQGDTARNCLYQNVMLPPTPDPPTSDSRRDVDLFRRGGPPTAVALAYTAGNITYFINSISLALIHHDNFSALYDPENDILGAYRDSTANLEPYEKLSDTMDTTIFWGADFKDFPFQYQQLMDNLFRLKGQLFEAGIGQGLASNLTNQREAAKKYIDLALSKIDEQRYDMAHDDLWPTFQVLDCGIEVFKDEDPDNTRCPKATQTPGLPSGLSSGVLSSAPSEPTATGEGEAQGSNGGIGAAGSVHIPLSSVAVTLIGVLWVVLYFS